MMLGRLLWNFVRAGQGPGRWVDRAALERWQEKQVRKMLRRVLPGSPWLRGRFAGRGVEAWREVPVTGKAEAMGRFTEWNTAGVSWEEACAVALRAEGSRDFAPLLRGLTVGLSSGTSGGRGIFLASAAERAEWAGTMLGKVLPRSEGWLARVLPGRHRVALLLRAGGGLYEAAGRGRVQFRWFDLMGSLKEMRSGLEEFDPTVLVGPPSVLRWLAESGMKVGPVKVVCCAETLDALDRGMLERGYGVGMDEVYQATEGFIAATDAAGVLRLNEDVMVVEREWVDEERTRFVPVITDFRRVTQPMVRHRLDDVLVALPGTEQDVFRGLAGVEGRCEDQLVAGAADGELPVFGDGVVRAVLRGAAVRDFRVWQVAVGQLEVALDPDVPVFRGGVTRELQRLWAGRGAAVRVEFRAMPEGEAQGIKRRRVRGLGKGQA